MHQTRTPLRGLISVAAIITLGAIFGVTGFSAQAAAQDNPNCETPVVDVGADVDVAQVQDAIDSVAVDGPTYIVRSYATVPDADLVALLDQLIETCFAGSGGNIRDDLILFSVSRQDRVSVVQIGQSWVGAIPESERDWLRTEIMSPQFAQENFTGGLVDAIVAADQLLLEAQLANPDTSSDVASDSTSDPESDLGSENAPASENGIGNPVEIRRDGSGRTPLYAIAGALALILIGGSIFALVNSRRKVAAARRTLEKALSEPRLKVGALRERFDRLAGQADVWERTTAGKSKARLRSLLRENTEAQQEVERSAALLSTTIPNGIENGSPTELRRATTAGVALSKTLENQELELDRLTAFGAHLDHLRIALPTKKELLTEELDEVELLAASRQSQGWDTDNSRSVLAGIEQGLSGVNFDDLELDLLSLSAFVEQAEADLFATDHHLENLPNQLESLVNWDTELDEAAELELKRIDALRKELSVLARDHASSSWDWAVDHPEQALEELEMAHRQQEIAMSEQLPAQQLQEAGKSLERAGLHLIQADRQLDEVDDLLVDLEQARIETPGLLVQAEEILTDLTKFVSVNAADLDQRFQNEPAEFAGAIAGIETELSLERPNYLRVAETLDRINRRLDEALAGAKDAQARAQALRREAEREVARADRTLRRTERALGWELIPSKDGRAVDRLREALSDLPDDPQQRIIVAANIADGALQVQERIIARRRRRTAWTTTGSGGGFGSGWSGGSGSKGSSWSRGGGRSSGGRSFGGGVSRGGRSFGGGRSVGSF